MLLAKYVENGSRQHMASGHWCPHPVTFLFISWRNIKLIGGFDYLESLWSTAEFDEKKVREKFEQVDTWWRKGYDTTTMCCKYTQTQSNICSYQSNLQRYEMNGPLASG